MLQERQRQAQSLLAGKLVADLVEGKGQSVEVVVAAAGLSFPLADTAQEAGGVPGRGIRPGPADEQGCMVIRTADESFPPRIGAGRLDAVLTLESFQVLRPEMTQAFRPDLVSQGGAAAVDSLEHVKQQDQLFQMFITQLAVHGKGGVGHGVAQSARGQVAAQLVDVGPGSIDLLQLPRGEPVDQQVDLAAVFREIGGCFHAGDYARRITFLEQQSAVQPLVIRDGDQLHALLSGFGEDHLGIRVGFPRAEGLQDPLRGPLGIDRVHMQIRSNAHSAILAHRAVRELWASGYVPVRTSLGLRLAAAGFKHFSGDEAAARNRTGSGRRPRPGKPGSC
jgi:hypothetical protein